MNEKPFAFADKAARKNERSNEIADVTARMNEKPFAFADKAALKKEFTLNLLKPKITPAPIKALKILRGRNALQR